jgi:AraC-like DNA-binding protein
VRDSVLILPPSAALADRVLFYVARRPAPHVGPGAPPPQVRFPANMYSAMTLVHSGQLHDGSSDEPLPTVAFSGLMSRAVLRRYVDAPETTVVVFRPGALTDLVHLPAFEFSDHWVDASNVLARSSYAELGERVLAQRGVARRIHALELVLLRRFAVARGPGRHMSAALQSLVWQLPRLSVGELADRFGSSKRGLQRRFRDTFGASPRLLARLARLQLALWYLQRRSHRLAKVARAAGFADAAHLSREVREFVGITPSMLAEAMRADDVSWALAAPQDALHPFDERAGEPA